LREGLKKLSAMKIFVNDKEIDLLPGMAIRHALIGAGLVEEVKTGKKVYDEWGNEIGLDGALTDDTKLYVR